MERSTWVEVSGDALRANLKAAQARANVPVCAVVKADAYGHGAIGTARILADAGAAMLAVTRIEEAKQLRDAGITAPMLVMMPVPDLREALALDVDVTIDSAEQVEQVPPGARVHLKIDVGMGRLGVSVHDAASVARALKERDVLRAVWTHLPDASGPSGRAHLERFRTVVTAIRHDGIQVDAHAANSAALCALPGAAFDMVRVGTLLYGQHPAGTKAPFPLEETFRWYARVASVRVLPEAATVGYGLEWRAKERTRVATIPVGYADGFGVEPHARTPTPVEAARGLAHIAVRTIRRADRAVFFGDQRASVVGRIGMQAVTVSLTGVEGVEVGSVARIPARRLLVSPRIERLYG